VALFTNSISEQCKSKSVETYLDYLRAISLADGVHVDESMLYVENSDDDHDQRSSCPRVRRTGDHPHRPWLDGHRAEFCCDKQQCVAISRYLQRALASEPFSHCGANSSQSCTFRRPHGRPIDVFMVFSSYLQFTTPYITIKLQKIREIQFQHCSSARGSHANDSKIPCQFQFRRKSHQQHENTTSHFLSILSNFTHWGCW